MISQIQQGQTLKAQSQKAPDCQLGEDGLNFKLHTRMLECESTTV